MNPQGNNDHPSIYVCGLEAKWIPQGIYKDELAIKYSSSKHNSNNDWKTGKLRIPILKFLVSKLHKHYEKYHSLIIQLVNHSTNLNCGRNYL